MTKIEKIESIVLSRLNFDKNDSVYDEFLSDGEGDSLVANLSANIEKIGVHEPDDGHYRAILSLFGKIKIQNDEDPDKEKSSVLADILIAYQVNFLSKNAIQKNGTDEPDLDEDVANELRDIIEPYYREILQSLFTRSSLEMPPLPYRMRRSKND